jgi:hypothetical protein
MPPLDIDRMLPQIKERASLFGPGIIPRQKKANPIIMVNIIPIAVSGLNSALSAIGPMRRLEKRQKRNPTATGLTPKRRPNMAPAKAEWAIVTPKKGISIVIMNTPITEQLIPPKKLAKIAF